MISLNSIEVKKSNFDIINMLLVLALFMSQFYLWSSGLPQFSHILIALALILFLIKNNYINISNTRVLFAFIFYVTLVNIIWFLISGFNNSYLISTIYWWFNFIFFILLMNLKEKNRVYFLELILKVIFLSYVIEVVIWASGLGRFNFSPRYNGLFNDPNQMAFWVLSSCSIYFYLSTKKLNNIIIYMLALFLILLTLSRSAMLGFPFITLAIIIKQKGSLTKKILLSLFSLLVFMFVLSILYSYGIFDDIVTRFIQGLNEKDDQSGSRGFDALSDFPEYLLFGAGQGGYGLYTLSGDEIHSTWFGIFFYYGAVGLSLFLMFLYKIIRKLSFPDKILFLSPMLYGFTTYNARTTIFWFVIAVFIIANNSMRIMDKEG